jgi:hypothetical protein
MPSTLASSSMVPLRLNLPFPVYPSVGVIFAFLFYAHAPKIERPFVPCTLAPEFVARAAYALLGVFPA